MISRMWQLLALLVGLLLLPVFATGQMSVSGPLSFPDGTEALPGAPFAADTNTGFRRSAADTIDMVTGGADRWQITSAGHLFAVDDNTYDIGASGATRPRNVFIAGNTQIGGNAAVSAAAATAYGSGGSPILNAANSGTTTAPVLALGNAATASGTAVGEIAYGTSGASAGEKRSALIVSTLRAASGTNVTGSLEFWTNNAGTLAERLRISQEGNVGVNTSSFGTTSANVFGLGPSTAPTTSPTDTVVLWGADVAGAGTFGLNIRDEQSNVYTVGNNQILASATGAHGWATRSLLVAGADGAFAVQNNAGTTRFQTTSGAAGTGTQVRTAQATAPTCTTNCGTSPSVSGTDTAMIVTLGTGTPASPITVTFNGTWAAAPACTAANRTTAANYVQRVDSTTTTVVVYFAAGPSASDLVAILCMGVS